MRLLIASTGGHLSELVLLAPRLRPTDDEVWVTFDSKQSRSLLAGRNVHFVRETPPRDWRSVILNVATARRLMVAERPRSVVSNGAGIALSFLPLARARGLESHYIECSARTDAPSTTGRILERFPGISLYTQHEAIATDSWRFAGSVFDSYVGGDTTCRKPLERVVVTVGSLAFPYRRLLDRLQAVIPSRVDVLVQAGPDVDSIEWPGADVRGLMPPDELQTAMKRADVVIAHGGIGSALMAFEAGKSPILVPRLRLYGEHVDDHQNQIAGQFFSRGLAAMVDASDLTIGDLDRALGRQVVRAAQPRNFVLR